MTGNLLMSRKERDRKGVFESVRQGHIRLVEAALRLGISYRQTRRSYKRYCEEGDLGLVHKSRGKESHRLEPLLKASILAYYRDYLEGFGPTFASEKLQEAGYDVDHETLRRWLISAGLWQRHRKRCLYRARRERRHCFGELVQLDGSFHDWFSDGKENCLMNMVDDATTTSFSLLFHQETTEAAMRVLWNWIERYGIPLALYTDKRNIYMNEYLSPMDKTLGKQPRLSAFGKACKKLGIEIINAHSPQAKGRVERNHGVYQDRFVKELKLRKINNIEAANKLLRSNFISDLNSRFSVEPTSNNDAHRALTKEYDLYQIFCWESERQLQNDWTIRYKDYYFQIEPVSSMGLRPKKMILVKKHLDGKISLWYDGQSLCFHETQRIKATVKIKRSPAEISAITRKNSQNSPWRNMPKDWLRERNNKLGKPYSA